MSRTRKGKGPMVGTHSCGAPANSRVSLAVAILLLLGIAAGPFAAVASAQGANAAPGSAGSMARDTVQVHGHWVIEIREPDGRLVSRREFDNALTNLGASLLVGLVSREFQMGPTLSIALSDTANYGTSGPCSGGVCLSTGFSPANLIVRTAGNAISLAGTTVATSSSRILSVHTVVFACSDPTTLCVLANANALPFTSAVIPQQDVALNQIIQVSVTISFATMPQTVP